MWADVMDLRCALLCRRLLVACRRVVPHINTYQADILTLWEDIRKADVGLTWAGGRLQHRRFSFVVPGR